MTTAVTASLIAIALGLPAGAMAQDSHAAHHANAAPAAQQAAMTNGVVKRVDKVAGNVTIAHEPLTNLGMPGMTMTFLVKDRAWLDTMKAGSRIRFVAENMNGELTVVALEQGKWVGVPRESQSGPSISRTSRAA
jgi:Cu/Ag efflux protein CusF